MEEIRQELRRRYLLMLAPAAVGVAAAAVLHRTGLLSWTLPQPWARVVFVAAVALAAGLPLWFRAFFARTFPFPGMDRFCRFQRRLMALALVPAYLALAAYTLGVSGVFLTGTLLAALYGVYYFYPSSARLRADLRIFRVDRERAR